jgi:hypothetical protein
MNIEYLSLFFLLIILILSLQANSNLKDVHLDLSSNDLGSSIKVYLGDFGQKSCITGLDLSENSKF